MLVGCGALLPHPTQHPSAGASPTANASFASPDDSFVGLAAGVINQGDTTPALEFRSAGSRVLWSTGARASHEADVAPDLLASTPRGSIEILYDNPNRDSRLDYIGGDATRAAFIETNDRVLGLGGWKLWIIPGPSQQAVELDRGVGGQLPFFAISGNRLVWTAATAQPEMSQLLMVDLTSMDRAVLLSSPPERQQYWFPSIDGERIVFGTVEMAPDGESDQRQSTSSTSLDRRLPSGWTRRVPPRSR